MGTPYQKVVNSRIYIHLNGFGGSKNRRRIFKMIDINKYADFFHDGSIIDIDHIGNKMIISMESAEVDEEDVKGGITLAKDARIRGKLHIEEIKSVRINNKPYLEIIKKIYDEGGIVNFEIAKNSVMISIDWVNFPPNPKINEFSDIKIEAKKIWWENIPGLEVSM